VLNDVDLSARQYGYGSYYYYYHSEGYRSDEPGDHDGSPPNQSPIAQA
jgi:hypothetical protein